MTNAVNTHGMTLLSRITQRVIFHGLVSDPLVVVAPYFEDFLSSSHLTSPHRKTPRTDKFLAFILGAELPYNTPIYW